MPTTSSLSLQFIRGAVIALGMVSLSAPFALAGEQSATGQQDTAMQEASSAIVAQKDVAKGLYEMVFSPSQQSIFVAATTGFGKGASDNYGEGEGGAIYRLNAQTLDIEDRIALDQKPFGLAINQKTHTLFVGHTLDQSISAINLDSGEIRHLALATEAEKAQAKKDDIFGPNPRQLQVDEQSNTLYVTGVGDRSVLWIINGDDLSLEDTIEGFGVWATGLAVDAEAGRIYVSTVKDNAVRVVDMKSRKILDQWPTGGEGPLNLALDHDHHHLYVTNGGSADVTVLDTRSGEVVDTLESGKGALALLLDGNRLYVTNRDASTVTVYDRDSRKLLETVNTAPMPNSLLAVSDQPGVYVSLKQPVGEDMQMDKPDSVAHLDP